uniref:Uncharacterized protein n=1 Tax=Rhizophora mucronata TaxID=61149 RepID=A0A2P2Q2P3_RHIMU
MNHVRLNAIIIYKS